MAAFIALVNMSYTTKFGRGTEGQPAGLVDTVQQIGKVGFPVSGLLIVKGISA